MALQTLGATPPPFFKQGPSALSRLLVFSALALFLIVADARFRVARPIRNTLSVLLYPMQWLITQPRGLRDSIKAYSSGVGPLRLSLLATQRALLEQSIQANQASYLIQENRHLRQLLGLRAQFENRALVAQITYEANDPYIHKLLIDKGSRAGLLEGSSILDEHGVLGQITRITPWQSEVTLLTDKTSTTPVLNIRTGERSVAYGASDEGKPSLELRFVSANADVQVGDLVTTSGIDGIYPAGIPVARISHIDRQANTVFARIVCQPVAHIQAWTHVLVLPPVLMKTNLIKTDVPSASPPAFPSSLPALSLPGASLPKVKHVPASVAASMPDITLSQP